MGMMNELHYISIKKRRDNQEMILLVNLDWGKNSLTNSRSSTDV